MNTQALRTDKSVYKPGDAVSVYFSFCRNRPYTANSQWKLVDDVVTIYPETDNVLQPACVANKLYIIGKIPPDAITGPHHLEGSTQIQINSLNSIYVDYRSVDFQVI